MRPLGCGRTVRRVASIGYISSTRNSSSVTSAGDSNRASIATVRMISPSTRNQAGQGDLGPVGDELRGRPDVTAGPQGVFDGPVVGELLVAGPGAQGDHRVGGVPVAGDQSRRAGGGEGHHPRHLRTVGDRVQCGGDRRGEGGLVHGVAGAGVQHEDVRVLRAERLDDLVPYLRRWAVRIVEPAAGQDTEHAGAPGGAEPGQQHRERQDAPPRPDHQLSPLGKHGHSQSSRRRGHGLSAGRGRGRPAPRVRSLLR